MTITPERLAELRARAKWFPIAEPSESAPTLDPKMNVFAADVVELVQAADNLAALLAAAECYEEYQEATWAQVRTSFREKFAVPDGVDTEVWVRSMWTAAIRRAKGEKS